MLWFEWSWFVLFQFLHFFSRPLGTVWRTSAKITITVTFLFHVFVAASHQTRLDTRSKARRPIKVGIKGRGRSGRSRDSNPACLCCSLAHLVQCEPDEASSFTNPNVGPGTYASLRLKLDAWSRAVQRGQKCSSPTRRLPSRSWGPIRPRVCSWFRAPIRHECQTAQLKSRERTLHLPVPPFCFLFFLFFWQDPSICLSFQFHLFSFSGLLEWQNPVDD